MISPAFEVEAGALFATCTDDLLEMQLDDWIEGFDDEVSRCEPGSHALHRAVELLSKAVTNGDIWETLSTYFNEDTDRHSMAGMLIRNHLATSAVGMQHVSKSQSTNALGAEANAVLRALTPAVRAEIVRRWSEAEHSSVYLTPSHFIAVEIPGTSFRCSLMFGALSDKGLNLSQRDVTHLLTTQLEELDPGTNALSMLPDIVKHQRYIGGQLLVALLGPRMCLLPGVDEQAVNRLAVSLSDSLVDAVVNEWLDGPLAAFFDAMGDKERAFRSIERMALTCEKSARLTNCNDPANVYLRAANYRSIAALHFEGNGSFASAANEYLQAATNFEKAGELRQASEHRTLAAMMLTRTGMFAGVVATLDDATKNVNRDPADRSAIYQQWADAFAERHLKSSAALLHILAADYLQQQRADSVGIDALTRLEALHRRRARDYFRDVGMRGAPEDLSHFLWFAIEVGLPELTSPSGFERPDFVVRFEDASDFISVDTFEPTPGNAWVLLRVGDRTDGSRMYNIVTAATMRKLKSLTPKRHPTLGRSFEDGDFVEGGVAIDMLCTPKRVSAPSEPAAGSPRETTHDDAAGWRSQGENGEMISSFCGDAVGTAPINSDIAPGPTLDAVIREFDNAMLQNSTYPALFDSGVDWLKEQVLLPDNWACLGHFFKTDDDSVSIATALVQGHLATFPAGLDHLKDTLGDRIERIAPRLLGALTQDVRDIIVGRWSQLDGISLSLIGGRYFAVDIADTGFRCALIGDCLGADGLHLTQHEATNLLLSRVKGDPAGRTLMEVLPDIVKKSPVTTGRLLHPAIGRDGGVLPELDSDAIHALAVTLLKVLQFDGTSVRFREPFARFFGWMKDHARAGALRDDMAKILTRRYAQRPLPLEHSGDGRMAEPVGDRIHRQSAIANQHALAAFHFVDCNEAALAATHFVRAAARLYTAGLSERADEMMTCGQAQLLHVIRAPSFAVVKATLIRAFDACGANHAAITRISEFCADEFEKRGRWLSAAVTHEIAAECLPATLECGIDVDTVAMNEARARQQDAARTCYAKFGFEPAYANVVALVRASIGAQLLALKSSDGLCGPGYVIRFDVARDPQMCQSFNVASDVIWLLLAAAANDGTPTVYYVINDFTKRALLFGEGKHPYLSRTLARTDFVEGAEVVELLWAARPVNAARVVSRTNLLGSLGEPQAGR